MNERDIQLQRLFEAAKSADVEIAEAMPGPLRTRILAHWRAGTGAEKMRSGLTLLFRGALVGAAVVMLVSIAWSVGDRAQDPDDDVTLANLELRADVMP